MGESGWYVGVMVGGCIKFKDFRCDIINGDRHVGRHAECHPSGSMSPLGLRPRVTLIPRGDIWRVALHASQHVYDMSL